MYEYAVELDDEFEELVALELHDHVLAERDARQVVAQKRGFDNVHSFKNWIQYLKAKGDGNGVVL